MSIKEEQKPVIGIIGGTSQFGQWFRFFFEKNGCEVLVSGRKTKLTHKELAGTADIVIVSVPIRETVDVIKNIRGLLKPSALLCDFTSLKEASLKEMIKRKEGGVVGIHPLFGPLVQSMVGQVIVFSEGRNNNWVNFLEKIFKKNGAKVIKMSAQEHDRQMAVIQALTHFLNIVFARTIKSEGLDLKSALSTPIFKMQAILSGRVLGANPSLYTDIEIENKSFHKTLKKFLKEASCLSNKVLNGKKNEFEKEFRKMAEDMKDFIPMAQARSIDIAHILDEPLSVGKKRKVKIALGQTAPIACLGPEGTFSHIATKNIFPSNKKIIMASNIEEVFKTVEDGSAKYGVVPAENSIAGIVQESLDSLLDYSLKVVGSYRMDIHHCFMARLSDKSKIDIIKSHVQPLGQCREWIKNNFPNAKIIAESSTAEAIRSTYDDNVGFIGSEEAALEYKLNILDKNIEDKKNNSTEFYILSNHVDKKIEKELKPKHTIMIITVLDRPGVLNDVLGAFASRKINLAKLHSRTSSVKAWDYYFFLEVECLPDAPRFKEALKEIKKHCSIIRILGIV